MNKIFFGLSAVMIFFPSVMLARESSSAEDALSAFESYAVIAPAVSIPTVVEVPVSDPAFREGDYAVYEETTKVFQPSLYREKVSELPVMTSFAADVVPSMGDAALLSDGSYTTAVEFPVDTDMKEKVVRLTASLSRKIAATGFLLNLESYAVLPRSVEVSVLSDDGSSRVVLAKTGVTHRAIRFPKTIADRFIVTLYYSQPLRLSEISFFDEEALRLSGRSVRFLARPGERYALYFQSDRPVSKFVGESANFSDDRDVLKLSMPVVQVNALFQPADTDSDGVRNTLDNCANDANSDQRDENGNGRGDVCDDYDKDGISNGRDNCPSHPNRNQADTDRDGKGDVCDNEESRLTESRPWLPWVAMGFGAIVVVSLFVLTLRKSQ